MIYSYHCHHCHKVIDVWQTMKEKHEYTCECGNKCVRVFQKPIVKYNAGFYSATLGEWVHSHKDFENKLRKVRYVTGEAERLNDTSTPKDEWVDMRLKKEQKHKELMKEEQVKADMVYHHAQKG